MAEVGAQILPERRLRWYEGLTRYQWWVLFIGALAWTLDTMAQRMFVLARSPALSQLANVPQTDALVARYGNYATASMLLGWAVGGFYFGIVGDRWGRSKTLSASVLAYSIFTGLSGFSLHWWDFCIYRFLMGCGIGGAFATAATLIAETMPGHARAFALGMFQALSAGGNILASFVAWWIVLPEGRYFESINGGLPGWRVMFFLGAIPAVLVVFIMSTIKEPEAWLAARANSQDKLQKQMGDIRDMFTVPRWRRNTLVGATLAIAGVIGLWGVGFWSPELINEAMKKTGMSAHEIGLLKAKGTLLQDVGAFFGMFLFTIIATRYGRRIGFALSFVASLVVVVTVFLTLRTVTHVYVMLPLVGFVTLSVFGGYSIYFPEIYPTRLRSSGTAFCYNVARIVTAVIIVLAGPMRELLRQMGVLEPFRWGAVILCSFYLLGLVVLLFAPETKDKPLPED